MRRKSPSVLPGFGLSLGITCTYLSLMVLLPLATVFARSAELTGDAFWNTVTDPRVVASYRVTLGASFVAACVNTVFGLWWPGCWCATGFPAAGSSTRWSTFRSRCRRRSPASR